MKASICSAHVNTRGSRKSFLVLGCAAAVTLLGSSGGRASGCEGFFSSGPAVCGATNVSGYFGADVLTVSPTPLMNDINAAAVAVGAAGAGAGVGGFATATGSYGVAHLSDSSFTTMTHANPNLSSGVSATSAIGFVDGFSVGATSLNVRFVSSASGSFTGVGNGQVFFNLDDLTANSYTIYDQRLFLYSGYPSSSKTTDLTLIAGHKYLFNWTMWGEANAGNDWYHAVASSTADLSHTGHLTIDILDPGQSLTFLSGTNYSSSPVSAVPEPSTWAMMLLGFVGLGVVANRRRSRAVLIAA